MTLGALLLIIISSISHVAWNLFGKRRHPNLAFFAIACGFSVVAVSPVVLWNHALVANIPSTVWCWLAVTSLAQATYMGGLAAAYKHGHLSVAYPLARSLPVLMVAFYRVAFGHAQLTAGLYAGSALILIGALLLPLPHLRAWHWHHYRNLSCMFALVAALGTTGYSIIDDHALRLLRTSLTADTHPMLPTLVYAAFEGFFTCLWLLPAVLIHPTGRRDAKNLLLHHRGMIFLAGLAMFIGYFLILLALAYARDVSYVVAFRQISIPLGAIAGITLLKEPAHRPKIIGVGLMFVGLVLTALG